MAHHSWTTKCYPVSKKNQNKKKRKNAEWGVVAHVFNPMDWEAEASRSLPHREILSQKTKKKRKMLIFEQCHRLMSYDVLDRNWGMSQEWIPFMLSSRIAESHVFPFRVRLASDSPHRRWWPWTFHALFTTSQVLGSLVWATKPC